MIQITRQLAKVLRSVIKRTFSRQVNSLQVRASDQGLFVEVQGPNHALRYHDPFPQDAEQLGLPLQVFDDVQNAKAEPVFLNTRRDGVVGASWRENGVFRDLEYDAPVSASPEAKFPDVPAKFTDNPPELLTAIRDAYDTTDMESKRYALGCIQLRRDGVIAATDGRQMLRQCGFQFPGEGEVLVQHTRFFSCKELPDDQPVRVGRDDNHVVFQFGPWTHWVAIQKEGRFPNVDQIIPSTHYAKCTLQIAPQDSKFLVENMHRLPNGTTHRELTLDLNGSVVLRAASVNTPRPAEMILRNSTKRGDDVRICTDRKFLARAAGMGFSDFHLPNDASPALATDATRTYLWMLLDQKEAIKPSENCLRIESPLSSHPFHSPSATRKVTPVNRIASSPGQNPESSQPTAHAVAQPPTTSDQVSRRRKRSGSCKASNSLEQAIALRDQLRNALTNSKELIRTLKTEKRNQKSLKLALDSLKQLQAVA